MRTGGDVTNRIRFRTLAYPGVESPPLRCNAKALRSGTSNYPLRRVRRGGLDIDLAVWVMQAYGVIETCACLL